MVCCFGFYADGSLKAHSIIEMNPVLETTKKIRFAKPFLALAFYRTKIASEWHLHRTHKLAEMMQTPNRRDKKFGHSRELIRLL